MHHGTCVTHVPWCMSGSLTCGDGENVPGIPGACALAILRIWQEAHRVEKTLYGCTYCKICIIKISLVFIYCQKCWPLNKCFHLSCLSRCVLIKVLGCHVLSDYPIPYCLSRKHPCKHQAEYMLRESQIYGTVSKEAENKVAMKCMKPNGPSSCVTCHDDVIEWKHFSRYWPFV